MKKFLALLLFLPWSASAQPAHDRGLQAQLRQPWTLSQQLKARILLDHRNPALLGPFHLDPLSGLLEGPVANPKPGPEEIIRSQNADEAQELPPARP